MKIPKKDTSRVYEVTYLVPSGLSDADVTVIKDTVEKLIKKNKGSITSTVDWGEKALAYTISHNKQNHRSAFFVHTLVEMPAENAQALERGLQIEPSIIRHLMVIADDSPDANQPVVSSTDQE